MALLGRDRAVRRRRWARQRRRRHRRVARWVHHQHHRGADAQAVGGGDQRPALAAAAGRAVHRRSHRRPRRDRPVRGRRGPGLADPGLPRPQGPGAGPDPGSAARFDTADRHPRRADQGDQRLHGDDRRARAASPTRRRWSATCWTRPAPRSRSTRRRRGPSSTAPTVEINGKTQARATLLAHNAANGSSVSGNAATDGLFTLSLADLDRDATRSRSPEPIPRATSRSCSSRCAAGSGMLTAVLGSSDVSAVHRRPARGTSP